MAIEGQHVTRAAAQDASRDQQLRAVADRRDRFAVGGHRPRVRSTIAWRMRIAIGRVAARDDQRVEVAAPHRAGRGIRGDDEAALAGVLPCRVRPDERHDRAGLA